MRRRWLVAVALLVATPAYADRVFVSGFEFCDAVNPNNTAAEEQFIFSSASNSDSVGVKVAAASAPWVAGNYCNWSSGSNRGKTCTTNSDCGTASAAICWTDPGNVCLLRMTPTDAGQEWVKIPFRQSDNMFAHLRVNVTTIPATVGAYVDIAQFGTTGVLLRAERLSSTTYQLATYYGTAASRCNSSENNGMVCTANSDCATFTPGESFCTTIPFGVTPALTVGGSYVYDVLLGQQNAVGSTFNARITLKESGFDRGSPTVTLGSCDVDNWPCAATPCSLGRCTNWTAAGDPEGDDYCTLDAQCGAGTCNLARACKAAAAGAIPQQSGLILGNDTAASGTWVVDVDNVVIDTNRDGAGTASSTGMATLRIARMTPDGDTTTDFTACDVSDCTGNASDAQVDELESNGTTVDTNTFLKVTNASACGATDCNEKLTLSAVTLSAASGDSITNVDASQTGAVQTTLFTSDNGNAGVAGAGTMRMTHFVYNGSVSNADSCGTDDADCMGGITGYDCAVDGTRACSFYVSQQGGPTDVYAPITFLHRKNASGNAWTGTTYNSLQTSLNYDRISGTNEMDLTAIIAEADIATSTPALPGIARDENGDGTKRLCIAGDSVANDLDGYIGGRLEDFTSLVTYTKGSTTPRDILQNIHPIMDGVAEGYMDPVVRVGDFGGSGGTGKGCDYLVVLSATNLMSQFSPTPNSYCSTTPFATCVTSATCTGGGTCNYYATGFCRGGTNHGKQCACPRNSEATHDRAGTPIPSVSYCVNHDTSPNRYLSTNVGTTCADCTTDSTDCTTNIPCTTNTDCRSGTCNTGLGECYAPCTGNRCTQSLDFSRADSVLPLSSDWNLPGCLKDECPSGLCIAGNTVAEGEDAMRGIIEAVNNRACVDVSGTLTCDGQGDVTCTTNTDCALKLIVATEPAGTPGLPGAFTSYGVHKNRTEALNRLYEKMSYDSGNYFVDIDKWYRTFGFHGSPAMYGNCSANTDCIALGLEQCLIGSCNVLGGCSVGTPKSCSQNADCNTCYSAYRDNIHHVISSNAYSGLSMDLNALEACMENTRGHADGSCEDGLCASGKINMACEDNHDCDLYYCAIGTPPFSWGTSFRAWWKFEETTVTNPSTAKTALNYGSLGTACNLTDSHNSGDYIERTVSGSATAREGTKAALFTRSASHQEWFSTTNADCLSTSTGISSASDRSYGGWFNLTQTGATQTLMDNFKSNNGWKLTVDASNQAVCTIGNGLTTTTATWTTALTSTVPSGTTWHHVICVVDDTPVTGTVKIYGDGVLRATSSALTMSASTATTFSIGGSSSLSTDELGARVDEVFSVNKALTAPQIARIATCGVDGLQAGTCACNTTDQTLFASATTGPGRYYSSSSPSTDWSCMGDSPCPPVSPDLTNPPALDDCNASAP